ncbi:patatin-like phospholipase family protein [Variovorax robiniae]|uniref:Patatin-like phospholipase family protein n=1 Tax=Variovorax robiniae TaxID=1836199 RepID=A0ABU8XHH1_9BURK
MLTLAYFRPLRKPVIGIEVVAGASVGALIGALYSSGKSPAEIRQLAEKFDVATLTDWHISQIYQSSDHSWSTDTQRVRTEKLAV